MCVRYTTLLVNKESLFCLKEPNERVAVTVGNQNFEVSVEPNELVRVQLIINNTRFTIAVSSENIRNGIIVKACGVDIHLKSECDDKTLRNYALNFLQWYFNVIQMKDAIREGNMKRVNIVLKNMIPFFYSHSVLLKYMVECMDYMCASPTFWVQMTI